MFDRLNALQTISDVTKDACGFRMRHINWDAMNDAELEAEYDYWVRQAEHTIAEENAAQELTTAKWNEHIAGLMADNEIDRATALWWDMEAMGAYFGNYPDVGYYCYLWGISYENEKEIVAEI